MGNLLENYNDINDIKKMSFDDLNKFSNEIREFLIYKISKTGGHLASNLGIVELTLSLYKVFDFNKDKLIWDVGHQCYVHKILTNRKDKFDYLRQYNGISGFPKPNESIYDNFGAGHSSTSISAAVGMARARDLNNEKYEIVSIIGDGALTGGMALEALNDLGYSKNKVIIILNDNQMSIDKNVGGMSSYLEGLRNGDIKNKETLFDDIGIKYVGPINGHNIKELTNILYMCKNIDGPVLIHTVTKKGKGYKFAENSPNKFHGIGAFNIETGECISKSKITYSNTFGDEMINLAKKNSKIVAITAAMSDGTGLRKFSETFPNRYFDVGIAEQHAVTMAAGFAASGFKPVFAVYSTFLQRAYDQVLHDVCIQNLPVIFAIDRAGIVGNDGETHQGIFDISFLSHIPNLTIISPKSTDDLRIMLRWAVKQNFPIAIRYPRGGDTENMNLDSIKEINYGKWEVINEKGDIVIIAVGNMVNKAFKVSKILDELDIKVSVINGCFIKPLDEEILRKISKTKKYIFTLEDNVIKGGFGNNVLDYLNTLKSKAQIVNLGFKDNFVPQGDVKTLYKVNNLDVDGILNIILKTIHRTV